MQGTSSPHDKEVSLGFHLRFRIEVTLAFPDNYHRISTSTNAAVRYVLTGKLTLWMLRTSQVT